MKKTLIWPAIGVLFFILVFTTLRPVHIPDNPEELLVDSGRVIAIHEGGENDVVFRLENNKTRYYINRGLEYGLVLEDLQRDLIGNDITIRYPKHWTLLDPSNRIKHMSILEHNGQELFNEIDLIKESRRKS